MRSFRQSVVMGIFGALTFVGLHAQTVDMHATIPFDFNVGQASMPAGDYSIHVQGTLVTFRRLDGKPANAFVRTFGAVSAAANGSSRLDFYRYGDAYFLASIRDGIAGNERVLPPTGSQKEMAKRLGTAVEAAVMAKKR